jgi:tetratricopeptide (TPR) repeat protein
MNKPQLSGHFSPCRLSPIIKGLFLCQSLLFATSAYAAGESARLKELIDSKQPEAAYALASQYRDQMEGDIEFDYYYGVAAIDSGHVNEGVFALERVVYRKPNHSLARLELARGYFMQGDDARARKAFERVLQLNPPQKVVTNIEHFLAAIRLREMRYRTTAKAYIELEAGTDSNVNAGPSDPLADSALPWTLDSSVLEQDDTYGSVSAGGQVNHPLNQHTSLFGTVDAALRHNATHSNYDNTLLTLQGGGQWQYEHQRRRLSLMLQQFSVDGAISRDLIGVSAENTWLLDKQHQLSLSLNAISLRYPEIRIKDSSQYTLGAQWLSATEKMSWLAALNLGKEVSDDRGIVARSQADRTLYGTRLAAQWVVTPLTSWGTNLTVTHSDYSADYLFGILPKRSETLVNLDASATHLLTGQWQLKGGISYSQNYANIDMFNYQRTQVKLGVRYEFK